MDHIGTVKKRPYIASGVYVLRPRTLIAAVLAVGLAQMALAIPASLNGLFQLDLGTSSSQLTWISDVFLIPVCVLELNFGVLGDLFGRKRLLVIGALLIAVGELIGVLTPGAAVPTSTRLLVLWTGIAIAGIGAAAIFPTSLAMVAAGTHNAFERVRAVAIWAAALSIGNCTSPIVGGLAARVRFGSDPLAGWRWAFLAVLAYALFSLLVTAAGAMNSASPEGRSLDLPGQLTIAIALFAVLYSVIQGPTDGWHSRNILAGFGVGAIFLILFVVAERRSSAPLLRLDFFHNRNFATVSIVTVIGMFSFLGVAYSTSIRLSAIQGFSPLKTSIAFLCFNGMSLIQLPLTIRLLRRHTARWPLATGFLLMAAGAIWLASVPISNMSLGRVIPGFILVGMGFGLALAAISMVAVSTPPTHLAGMASGTTNMLRDFGFTLGPAVVGAVALSQAADLIRQRLATSPALQSSLNHFVKSAAQAPAAQRPEAEGAVHAVLSGPLGANAVPNPPNPLKPVAFDALGHSYALGFLMSGMAALLAAVVTLIGMRARTDDTLLDLEPLDE
ncbi:MAG: MFS transporter [Actinobacteria bacterium]|nr:MFS transporter [Actinomycetota bacterium]MBO0836036.1 MFS transporter [Actinomycetota bacterium]